MAGKGVKRNHKWKWTPETEDRLAALYGMYKPEHIAGMLSKETCHTFTRAAVIQQATQKLGIDTMTAQGLISISDAARELGVAVTTVHATVTKYKKLKAEKTRSGYCRYVTDETMDYLRLYYAQPPEPTITLQQAADRLKRGLDWTYTRVRAGKLKAWKCGANWRVSAQDTERLRWELARPRQAPQQGPYKTRRVQVDTPDQ